MRLILCTLLLLWTYTFQAIASENPPPALSVQIWDVVEANVCGKAIVTVEFSNSSATTCAYLDDIVADLDPGPNALITFSKIVNENPNTGFTPGDLSDLSQPHINFNGKVPRQSSVLLIMEIQFSCEYFDLLGLLNDHHIEISGTFTNGGCDDESEPPPGTPFTASSADFDIGYSALVPDLTLPMLEVTQEQGFNIEIPIAVSGTFCDDDFVMVVGSDLECLNFGQASYAILYNGQEYAVSPDIETYGAGFALTVHAGDTGIPAFCGQYYNGELGDLTMIVRNVKVRCGCGVPDEYYYASFGFTTCSDDEAPADCKDGDGHVLPQITTKQRFHLAPLTVGELTITHIPTEAFKICNVYNTLDFLVSNPVGGQTVYDVALEIQNLFNYGIEQIAVGSMVYHTNTVDFGDPGTGLDDADSDGIYAELLPGNSVVVHVTFSGGGKCGLGSGSQCGSNCTLTQLHGDGVAAIVRWNNACSTINPALATALSFNVDITPMEMDAIYDNTKMAYNVPETVQLDLGNGSIEGFEDYLDNGQLHQYLCVSTGLGCTTYYPLQFTDANGVFHSINYDYSKGIYDLGNVDADLVDNLSANFSFSINCCPATQYEIVVTMSMGVYFEDCPGCFIRTACADAKFLSPCSGNDDSGLEDACDIFPPNFTMWNTVDPGTTNPVNVYPCDDLHIELTAANVLQSASGELVIGFAISNEFLDYIDTWNGKLFKNGVQINVVPQPGPLPVGNKPYSLYYCSSLASILVNPGDVITGYLDVHMSDNFQGSVEHIDYFAPVLGLRISGHGHAYLSLCKENQELYGLDVDYSVDETRTATCDEGGSYSIELIKIGGKKQQPFDFNVYRPVAQFTGGVQLTLNGVTSNLPLTGLLDPTLPNSDILQGGTIQTLTVKYAENCTGDIPLDINYEVTFRPDANAPCQRVDAKEADPPVTGGSMPFVDVHFIGAFDVVVGNTYDVDLVAQNTGAAASHAWIQLEYNPAEIEILPPALPLDETYQFETGACGNRILVIRYNNGLNAGETRTQTLSLKFLAGSCATTPILTAYGMHSCMPTQKYAPVCVVDLTDPQVCVDDQDAFYFEFFDSDLLMSGQLCTPAGEICDVFTVSVILNNPGQANTSEVTVWLDALPSGVTLISAKYEDGSSTSDCDVDDTGLLPADINALLGSGWTIEGGVLQGFQEGTNATDRQVHLLLTFQGSCDIDTGNDNLTIHSSGLTPCGHLIERQQTFSNLFAEYDLNVSFGSQSISLYDCETQVGEVGLDILEVNNWQPNTSVFIHFSSSSPDIVFDDPANPTTPVIQINGLGPNSIGFTNLGSSCNFEITMVVEAVMSPRCGDETCTFTEILNTVTITTWTSSGNEPIQVSGSLDIPLETCAYPAPQPVTVTASLQSNVPIGGFNYIASLYCDLDADGVADPGEPVLVFQQQGTLPIDAPYTIQMSVAAGDLMGCNSPILMVIDRLYAEAGGESPCICQTPITATLCCNCPAWHVNWKPSSTTGGIEITLTNLVNQIEPGCVEVVASNSPGASQIYSSSHFIVYYPAGTEICVRIHSDGAGIACESGGEPDCMPLENCPSECCFEYCFTVTPFGPTGGDGRSNESSGQPNETAALGSTAVSSVLPNPSAGTFKLGVQTSGQQKVEFMVYDQFGKLLLHNDFETDKNGEGHYPLNLVDFANGLYYLQLNLGNRFESHLLIKQ